MEHVYSGYPAGLTAAEAGNTYTWGWGLFQGAEQTDRPAPYMLYRRDSQRETDSWPSREARRQAECDYFKGLYPQSVRRHQALVEEACDRLDYAGSPMFDEYPDREFLYQVRDGIGRRASGLGLEPSRDMVQLLLVNEMNRRRMLKRG